VNEPVRWTTKINVSSKSLRFDQAVGVRVVAPVGDVVDAIHDGAQVAAVFSASKERLPDRLFVVVEHEDGRECIAFGDASSPGRNLADMVSLDN
jgi:hypothetical protein